MFTYYAKYIIINALYNLNVSAASYWNILTIIKKILRTLNFILGAYNMGPKSGFLVRSALN